MTRRLFLPLLLFLVVFLAITLSSAPSEGKAGMGVSHYDASNVTVTAEQPAAVTVARIWNTGDEALNVTFSWLSLNETSRNETQPIPIMFKPSSIILEPEDSVKLSILVNPSQPGSYEGFVEIKGYRIAQETGGNPVVGGQSLTVKITVLPKPIEPKDWLTDIALAISIISASATSILFFKRRLGSNRLSGKDVEKRRA